MLRRLAFVLLIAASARAGFVQTGAMTRPRWPLIVTLLRDGRILVTDYGMTSEIYTPSTGQFRLTHTQMPGRFDGHAATLLDDGRVLISGGGFFSDGRPDMGTYGGKHSLLFDPASETFSRTGDLNFARRGHTATLLSDGRVLIAGGTVDIVGGTTAFRTPVPEVEIYDPTTGAFRNLPVVLARSGHTATLLHDGRVLIAGGAAEAMLFDARTEAFTSADKMIVPRQNHTATLLHDGRVLIIGGRGLISGVPGEAEIYDPATNAFHFAGATEPREKHAAAELPDGRVLIAGGFRADPAPKDLRSAAIYDPRLGGFIATEPMHIERVECAAVTLQNGQVLVTGGYKIEPPYATDVAELYVDVQPPPPRRRTVR